MANTTATVRIEGEETIKGTVKDFQTMFNVDAAITNGFIKFLEATGAAKNVGQQKSPSGKGKPSTVWEIPKVFAVNLKPESQEVKAA